MMAQAAVKVKPVYKNHPVKDQKLFLEIGGLLSQVKLFFTSVCGTNLKFQYAQMKYYLLTKKQNFDSLTY